MFKSMLKYGSAMVAGAIVFAITMHYGDDKILEAVKQDIDDVVDKAIRDNDDVATVVKTFVDTNYKMWVADLLMSSSVRELDSMIEKAKLR